MLYSCMPGYQDAAKFMTDWWNGVEMPRPVLSINVPVSPDPDLLMKVPVIEGIFCPPYTTKNLEYRLARENNRIISFKYFAEAMAVASPVLGPGSLAMYLGGQPLENEETVWVNPWYKSIKDVELNFDEKNPIWKFQWDLTTRLAVLGRDRFLVRPSDMLDGLDVLSEMLGPEQLLLDLMDYPEIVMEKSDALTRLYLQLFNREHEAIKDKLGGSHYLFWSPGRMYRGQCDFSAMLSPQMFRTYALPGINEIMETMDHVIYHWDGPGALCHLDALLETKKLEVLQWVPGAGNNPAIDKRWWPMYHKIFEAGKRIQLAGAFTVESLLPLKKEFRYNFYKFMTNMKGLNTEQEALNAINELSA